jgi:hypothetical protein
MADYAPDRTASRPIAHLAGFEGVLQVDGYAAYEVLAKGGVIRLAYCWSHARRLFYELAAASPIATEALARISALYGIETEIRGRPADERRAVRQERSRPVVKALKPWLREKLGLVSRKSKFADAIRYALSRWAGLSLFLDDGRVEIDSNIVERAIRPLALNRNNALFAGSDGGGQHWAVSASLTETCKLVGVEPHTYLTEVITRRAVSTTCCHGPTRPYQPSKPWPENSAYPTTSSASSGSKLGRQQPEGCSERALCPLTTNARLPERQSDDAEAPGGVDGQTPPLHGSLGYPIEGTTNYFLQSLGYAQDSPARM